MPKLTQGVIAAGHSQTAIAGSTILKLGGNAFDAAVAAILASFVVESTLTSAGGGGFLLAHTQDNRNLLFDFFTQTPRSKKESVNFYPVDVDFGGAIQSFHIGLGSMAVPGNIAGAFKVHRQLGRLPLSIVAEPAIQLAQKGVCVDSFQGFCINLLHPILQATPEARKIYAPQGQLLQSGDTFVMKEFAETLQYLVENGEREFYEGEIAHRLVKDCQEQGGYLTLEDLKNYSVILRKPLHFSYRNCELFTNPPPSSGGTLIGFALKLLETLNLETVAFGSLEHLKILSQVMRLTNIARKDGYDARIYENDVAERFLHPEHLHLYQQQLETNKWGSTTHISVIDKEGNAASVTTSNGEGSSYVIPGTGIMVNNMLGEADLNPQGFHQWALNQRISSMMAPTIALSQGKPKIVLGSGGSNRIRTAILQVLSNLIDFRMPVQQAVESPRAHWENQLFHLEPGLGTIPKENFLEDELVFWSAKNMFFGGVNVVQQMSNGCMDGAGDPRRDGAVLIC